MICLFQVYKKEDMKCYPYIEYNKCKSCHKYASLILVCNKEEFIHLVRRSS